MTQAIKTLAGSIFLLAINALLLEIWLKTNFDTTPIQINKNILIDQYHNTTTQGTEAILQNPQKYVEYLLNHYHLNNPKLFIKTIQNMPKNNTATILTTLYCITIIFGAISTYTQNLLTNTPNIPKNYVLKTLHLSIWYTITLTVLWQILNAIQNPEGINAIKAAGWTAAATTIGLTWTWYYIKHTHLTKNATIVETGGWAFMWTLYFYLGTILNSFIALLLVLPFSYIPDTSLGLKIAGFMWPLTFATIANTISEHTQKPHTLKNQK